MFYDKKYLNIVQFGHLGSNLEFYVLKILLLLVLDLHIVLSYFKRIVWAIISIMISRQIRDYINTQNLAILN